MGSIVFDQGGDGYTILVEEIETADANLVEIGKRYWTLSQIDDNGTPVWQERTTDIPTHGTGAVHAAAACGVRAVMREHACKSCGEQLVLTSREAFKKILNGMQVACVSCDEGIQGHIRKLQDPRARHKREARRQQQDLQRQETERKAQIAERQRHIVAERFPLRLGETPWPEPLTLRHAVALLALLEHAPANSLMAPLQQWPEPLHPAPDHDSTVLAELLANRLLTIHPDSDITAFAWDTSDATNPQLAERLRYYPLRMSWYVPWGPNVGVAHANTAQRLRKQWSLHSLPAHHRSELLDVAAELVCDETLRYLEFQLAKHNLPLPGDNHRQRVRETILATSRQLSLGQMYHLAWLAARTAAASTQEHPQAPRSAMTTFAINLLERRVVETRDGNPAALKAYGKDRHHELSLLTRTVYYSLLQVDPFTRALDDLEVPHPSESAGAEADQATHMPAIRCSNCTEPILPGQGWLWIDVNDALAARENALNPTPCADGWSQVLSHARPQWNISHDECAPERGGIHEIQLPSTWRGLMRAVAGILHTKDWAAYTDIGALLGEAAELNERFAPADNLDI